MDRIKNGTIKHLALTQLYRWFGVYERPLTTSTIRNQMSILADDITVTSISELGISQGKKEYEERLHSTERLKVSHFLQEARVKQRNDNSLELEAEVLHQMQLPDGTLHSNIFRYESSMTTVPGGLPIINKMRINSLGAIAMDNFEDTYLQNRMGSLLHCWQYYMETLKENIEPLRSLLTSQFEWRLFNGTVMKTWPPLEKMLLQTDNQVKSSCHFEKNLKIIDRGDNHMTLTVDFDWLCVTLDDQLRSAKTHHEWQVLNDPNEPFAHIKKIVVNTVQPVKIIEPIDSNYNYPG